MGIPKEAAAGSLSAMKPRALFPIALLSALLACAAGGASPRLDCSVSWIGNSFPGAQKWVQQDIAAMCVTADGTVFTNVPWEEGGGNAGAYKDGDLLGFARHTHGWGADGGEAVAVNAKYVFIGMAMGNEGGGLRDPATWPEKGSRWFGVSRRLRSDFAKGAPFAGGKGGKGDTLKECFLPVAEVPEKTGAHLSGMWADDARLYVSNPNENRVEVFDAETMQRVAAWPVERPGQIVRDAAGTFWMLQTGAEGEARSVLHFSAEGKPLPGTIPFTVKGQSPVALAITPRGELLVADDGPRQQIDAYAPLAGQPRVTRSIGLAGGIRAGVPGAFGDLKFNRLSAIGCDAAGNLYVAHHASSGGGSTVLESYTPDGKPRWRLFGLTFVDMADADPGEDADVFTKEERFRLDYTQPRGREWSYAGFTIDRYRFPDDPRLHIWSAGVWVRRIGGQRVLFVNDMNGERLQVYRFAAGAETAVPCGLFAKRRITEKKSPAWPPHQPEKGAWLWRDADGDGQFDAGEFAGDGADMPAAQGWWVDASGGVWLATERDGLRYFAQRGLDAHGVPAWDFTEPRRFPAPAEFREIKRLRYDAGSDVMYLGGTTAEDKNQHWKPMGPVLARYDGWLRGEPKLRWKIIAPYARGSKGHESCEPMGFDVAGDFVFVPYTGASKETGFSTGHVEVFKAADGTPVGHMEPSADIGEIGLQDIRETLTARLRADGEYLIFLEDDYKAKVLLYRWRPK